MEIQELLAACVSINVLPCEIQGSFHQQGLILHLPGTSITQSLTQRTGENLL